LLFCREEKEENTAEINVRRWQGVGEKKCKRIEHTNVYKVAEKKLEEEMYFFLTKNLLYLSPVMLPKAKSTTTSI